MIGFVSRASPRGLELVIPVGISLFVAAGAHKLGFDFVLLALMVLVGVLSAVLAPPVYAALLILSAPLPSVGAFAGIDVPVGLDPFTVLLIGGLLVAIRQPNRWPKIPSVRLLVMAALAIFLLYSVAWYRTYGAEHISPQEIAILIKPILLALSGVIVVALLPRDQLLSAVAMGLYLAQMVFAFSIVLQKAGLYESAYQLGNLERLGIKQYGGILLQGNTAGAMFAVYAVPTYLLLRATSRRRLGISLLVMTPAILLITLSRTALAAYGASLIVLVLLERNRVRNGVIAGIVLVTAVAWGTIAAQSSLAQLEASISGTGNTNAILSGRLDIWEQARYFLEQGHHFVLGAGLDAFQTFAGGSSLGNAFATHNALLWILTTGGLVLLGAYALLLMGTWAASVNMPDSVRSAVRIALVALLVVGLANDETLLSRMGSWIWLLLAVGIYLSTDRAASRRRSAIQETS